MDEIWKDIKGYENKYQVSNYGNVRSLARLKTDGRKISERILKPQILKSGYILVGLGKNGTIKMYLLHRLVATAFLGEGPKGYEVNHINENKSDNRVENLEWVDHLTNIRHGTGIQRKRESIKTRKPVEILSTEGMVVRQFISVAEAARQMNLSRRVISSHCWMYNKHPKKYGGYFWRFV